MLLDRVSDPRNIGAIIRVCAAFSVSALISTTRHGRLVAKTASRGLEHVHYIKVPNPARALTYLSKAGFLIIRLDSGSSLTLDEAIRHGPLGLVLGAENKGLRYLTRERWDCMARIALPGAIVSLNVSTAASLALHAAAIR